MTDPWIVDCWVNLNPGRSASFNASVGYLFREAGQRLTEGATPDRIVELMHENGIEQGLLAVDADDPEPALAAIEAYPEAFRAALRVNPHKGYAAVQQIERFHREHGMKAVKVSAHATGEPYNDKIYYPIYSKCIELGLPITANVGIPGPRVRGEPQNPIHLDEVCWFFPELTVVMTHMGEPWHYTAVKLMLKWPNLFLMTSAFAPKYYPREVVDFINTRGREKVMFASDYPLISFERCMRELPDLGIREEAWRPFMSDNARRVFQL